MKPIFWIHLVVIAVGVAVVSLRDENARLWEFSENHGLSFLNLSGLILLLIPWTLMSIQALMSWRLVVEALGRRVVTGLVTAALAGLLVVVVAVRSDSDYWIAGTAISFAAQLILIVIVYRK